MTTIEFQEAFRDKLKERGYTLKQLSEATGISTKHLESLSHGRFEHLPPAPYLHGYLEKIGAVLGFDPELWWSEIKHHEEVRRSGAEDRLPDHRFVKMHAKAWISGGVVILLLLIYVSVRFSFILGKPALEVREPDQAAIRTHEERFVVRGSVVNGEVFLNDERLTIGTDGAWEKELFLQSGPNTIEIRAKKLLGRETVVVRQIFYEPPVVPASTPSDASSPSSGGNR